MSVFMYKQGKVGTDGVILPAPFGTANISDVGDGTLTGAIRNLADRSGGVVDITQAQYNALSPQEKADDVFYRITDVDADDTIIDLAIGETAGIAYEGSKGKALANRMDTAETNINTINGKLNTIITGTLTTGQTSLEITNAAIRENSIISIFTDVYGYGPSEVTTINGKITLTFDEAKESNVTIKVVVLGGE